MPLATPPLTDRDGRGWIGAAATVRGTVLSTMRTRATIEPSPRWVHPR
jgi:hypothetical protein